MWALVFSGLIYAFSSILALCYLGLDGSSVIFMSSFLWLATPVTISRVFKGNEHGLNMAFVVVALSWLFGVWLLVAYWIPTLDQLDALNGVDPARYYYRSIELLNYGFNVLQVSGGLSDPGVLYYYALVMAIFGKTPFAPYFANHLIFILLILLMVRFIQKKRIYQKNQWLVFCIMLFPELVWFSVVPGKDFLVSILACIVLIIFVESLSVDSVKIHRKSWFLALCSFLTISFIRPTYLFVCFVGLFTVYLFANKKVRLRRFIPLLLFCATIVLILVPFMSGEMNSRIDNKSLINRVKITVSKEHIQKFIDKHEKGFSENSIGKKLIPRSLLELVYLAPVRGAAYLFAPLKYIWSHEQDDLMSFVIAQRYVQLFTSLMILLCVPVFIVWNKTFRRTWWQFKPFLIFSVVTLLIISNVIMIIQVRYRVFSLPPFLFFVVSFFAIKNGAKARITK